MNYRSFFLFVSAVALLAACSDEPRPCGWAPEAPAQTVTDAVTLSCGGMDRPTVAIEPRYRCRECVNNQAEQGLELSINLVDQERTNAQGTPEFYGTFRVLLPEQPLSGEMDLTSENVETPGGYEITGGRISWSRTEGMPYVDIPEDELVEGEVYSTSLTFELDLEASGGSSDCLVSSVQISQLSETLELSSEASFCEPFELEDLKDIRVGH